MPARSSATRRTPSSVAGTSPSAIRRARPSTIAVLPTPASPISTALFLRRRARISTVCSISFCAADHRVDPAVPRLVGEVAAELVERRGLGLRRVRAGLRDRLSAQRGALGLGRHQAVGARLADRGGAALDAVGGHDPQRPGTLAADGTGAAGDGAGGVGEWVHVRWLQSNLSGRH